MKSLNEEYYSPVTQWEKILFWYSFFMAFPIIVPIFNISIFIFPFLLISFKRQYGFVFRWKGITPLLLLLLTIGLVVNVASLYAADNTEFLKRSLQVVPNYMYWLLLIWFLYSQRDNLNYHIISKALFWGVIATTIFYFLIAPLRPSAYLPFIKNLSQNAYAFLIITFTPAAVRYSYFRYGRLYAWIFLLIIILSGFLSGSRSSSILVLLGGLAGLYLETFQRKRIIRFGLIGIVFFLIFQMSFVEALIKSLNPRTHDLLYQTSSTLKTDRSFLVRQAQIEKGLELFKMKPFTGIGLNNFTSYKDVKLPGIFEGAKYVINKPGITETSSHNSYINLLAEGGIALALPFGLLIIYMLVLLLKVHKALRSAEIAYVIGFVMMLIHLYFITALVNVFCWFMIGLVLSILKKKSEEISLPYSGADY